LEDALEDTDPLRGGEISTEEMLGVFGTPSRALDKLLRFGIATRSDWSMLGVKEGGIDKDLLRLEEGRSFRSDTLEVRSDTL